MARKYGSRTSVDSQPKVRRDKLSVADVPRVVPALEALAERLSQLPDDEPPGVRATLVADVMYEWIRAHARLPTVGDLVRVTGMRPSELAIYLDNSKVLSHVLRRGSRDVALLMPMAVSVLEEEMAPGGSNRLAAVRTLVALLQAMSAHQQVASPALPEVEITS